MIDKEIIEKLSNIKKNQINKEESVIGTNIFEEKDIKKCTNILDLLLRSVFVQKSITLERFNIKYKKYSCLKTNPKKIYDQKKNVLAAIKRGNLSYAVFITVISHILEFEIMDVEISLNIHDSLEKFNLGDLISAPPSEDEYGKRDARVRSVKKES